METARNVAATPTHHPMIFNALRIVYRLDRHTIC
jgi:hypothetical protein